MTTSVAVTTAVTVASLVVTACGHKKTRPPPQPTTALTTTAPATTTTVDPALPVLAGYRAFWDAYLAAADPMDPTNANLAAHAAGAELQHVQATFIDHFQKGEVIRGSLDLHPSVASQTSTTATVADCYGDSTHLFDKATGRQKDPAGSATFQVVATLLLDGGAWKVTGIDKRAEGCTPS